MSVFDIYSKLGYNFWFNSSKKNDDHVLNLLGWSWVPKEIVENRGKKTRDALLDSIVVADQLTRHFFRGQQAIIDDHTELAINLAEIFLSRFQLETKEELLFVTLPLRHLPTPERHERVVKYIEYFMRTHPIDEKFCGKILTATRKRYALHQRNNRALATDDDGKVLTTEILESGTLEGTISPTDSQLEVFRRILPNERFLLSLSGGVDSMVLACLLKACNVPFHAYHLNYGRRTEANVEANFLREFCAAHDIPLTVETIDPLSSDVIYNWEEATRQKRFTDYLQIGGEGCYVLMGHHIDDTKENLLMNLFNTGSSSGGRYLWKGLNGMPIRHPMRGVVIYRPLTELGVGKDWVLDLAHKYDVPYFKDSSFELATRIRIRRELLPLMRNIFGAHLDSQLLRVVEQGDILTEAVENVFYARRDDTTGELTINMERFLESDSPIEIHKSSFMDVIMPYFFGVGKNLPSHSSIKNMLIRVKELRPFNVFFRGHIRGRFDGIYIRIAL